MKKQSMMSPANNQKNSLIRIIGSIMIIIGTMIGAGILALPIVTAQLGFLISSISIVVVWSIMTYTAVIIADISCSMPRGSSFKTITEKYLGKTGGVIASISFLVLMYFISTAYISAASSSLTTTFHGLSNSFASFIFVFILGGIVILGTRFVDITNRFVIILKIIILLLLCLTFFKHIELNNEQIVGLLKNQQENIQQLHKTITAKDEEIELLKSKIKELSITHYKLDELKNILQAKKN